MLFWNSRQKLVKREMQRSYIVCDYGIFELHLVGVPTNVLRRSGFDANELHKGRYAHIELIPADYTKDVTRSLAFSLGNLRIGHV